MLDSFDRRLIAATQTGLPLVAEPYCVIARSLGVEESAVRTRLTELGLAIVPREQQTPEALRAFQKAEIKKWWPIIKEAGIKGE